MSTDEIFFKKRGHISFSYSGLFLLFISDLQLLRIMFKHNSKVDFLMSEASALYGFRKELMPNLQIRVEFSSDTPSADKRGLENFIQ